MEVNPIAIILVHMDSKGDRLLYRYPYQHQQNPSQLDRNSSTNSNSSITIDKNKHNIIVNNSQQHNISIIKKRNPYAIQNNDSDLQATPSTSNQVVSNICASKCGGELQGFADELLSTLFAVKQQLCAQKFELKINDVRFVSHPTMIQKKEPVPQQMLINIVFAIHAHASYSIVKCYHELSKRLGLALKVEEQRIGYVSEETLLMARTHDEISTKQQPLEKAFDIIGEKCSLAQSLKSIFQDLCTTGLLSATINQNVTLSFCLPQKAHQMHKKGTLVDPDTIDNCLRSLKPYHGMLLLVDFAELLDCVPPAGARMLLELVEVYTPLMSLQSMASDAELSLEHVYKLVSHLVYWAKATIIYPLCETNVYVIAPDAPLHTKSHLVEKFSTRFPGMSLFEVIANFSLPTSIGHLTTPLQQPARQGILAQMVLWMLQHHLLMQLHTYVQFMPSDLNDLDDSTESLLEMHDLCEVTGVESLEREESDSGSHIQELLDALENSSDEELNADSLLNMSSQPLPVPNSRRSITEDNFSAHGSSDNIAQPSSSHKSNFSMTASISTENCDSITSVEDEEKVKVLLQVFEEADQEAIRKIHASMNVDDLSLMVKLYEAGYFKSEHHLEEIMYFENLRRSQLLQLLDKFRNVLIIYETEDPAIASMYNNNK